MLKKEKVYIPRNEKLSRLHHDTPVREYRRQ